MLDFLFRGGATQKKHRTQHPFPSSSSRAYPPSAAPGPYGGAEGGYDDVALGGDGGDLGGDGGDLGKSGMTPSRPSFSAPPASDGAFVGSPASSSPATSPSAGAGGYSAESSYPPLPSFSRPSSSSNGSATRYPPLRATFARLRALLDEQSPALHDTLSEPLSPSDPELSSLRAALAPYVLPPAVVDSYLEHDGQDPSASSGGGAAGGARVGGLGLVYGLWWLPLERVEEEWRFWRALEDAGGLRGGGIGGDAFGASVGAQRGGRAHPYVRDEEGGDEARGSDVEGMGAFPDGWVRKRYSHPGWLPLLTDRCGNYIGVDLDPPPPAATSPSSPPAAPGAPAAKARTYGQPGQVIAFGREIDQKVVLFPGDGPSGWARFLAAFVDDVERGEFARLGERPAARDGAVDEEGRGWDEEQRQSGAGRRASGSGSSEEGGWGAEDDGLGDRGYFETDVYGEEVVGSGPGARSAQTWVLRSEYRRLAAKLDLPGGVIGLLCERSRRKWRSLGVGSATPQPRGMLPMTVPQAGKPLSVVVPASSGTGVNAVHEEEEEPQSATTERPSPALPVDGTAAAAAESSVSLVLSPPSPTKASLASRTSHDSSRSHASNTSARVHLRDPPRSSRTRPAQPARQPRRPPPPPPAALDLPTFSDLDFSDTLPATGEGGPVVPKASWLLSDGRDVLASAGAALSRLSIGSNGSGGGGGGGAGAGGGAILPVALSRAESEEQGIALAERNSSRTALVGGGTAPTSPVEHEVGSPVERVEVVAHRT